MSSVAVFWDRDNTLIDDPGFISDPGQVKLLPGAAEALKRLSAAGFENVIITNQSGIARGYFDEAALERVHDRVVALFAEQGAKIDAIYYCPYLPGDEAKIEKYRRDSELRKPRPGMILQASLERKLELAGSWMVGDKVQDAQAGRAAGCRTILIRRPGTPASRKSAEVDFLVDTIEQAAATVLKYTRRASTPSQPSTSPPAPAPTPMREPTPPPAPPKPVLAPSAKRGVEAAPAPPTPVPAPSSKRGAESAPVPPTPVPAPSASEGSKRVSHPFKGGGAIAQNDPPLAPPPTQPTEAQPTVEPPVKPAVEPAPTATQGVAKVPEPPPAIKPPEPPTAAPKREAEPMSKPPAEPHAVEPAPSVAEPSSTTPELAPSANRGVATPTQPPPAKNRPEAQMSTDATALLHEILTFLRMVDRRSRVEEFALGKLLGAIAQIMAIGALTWSLFGLIRDEPVIHRLGFAILFQLMALTCFALSPRK